MYKVVGCLLFADGDLVTHETVAFALAYLLMSGVSLSNNSMFIR